MKWYVWRVLEERCRKKSSKDQSNICLFVSQIHLWIILTCHKEHIHSWFRHINSLVGRFHKIPGKNVRDKLISIRSEKKREREWKSVRLTSELNYTFDLASNWTLSIPLQPSTLLIISNEIAKLHLEMNKSLSFSQIHRIKRKKEIETKIHFFFHSFSGTNILPLDSLFGIIEFLNISLKIHSMPLGVFAYPKQDETTTKCMSTRSIKL